MFPQPGASSSAWYNRAFWSGRGWRAEDDQLLYFLLVEYRFSLAIKINDRVPSLSLSSGTAAKDRTHSKPGLRRQF
jgi:hypothetical protein